MYEVLVGVQIVNGGWLTDLHFRRRFPSCLQIYEQCKYITVNVHDSKNQEKSNAIFSAPSHTQEKKGNIFVAVGKNVSLASLILFLLPNKRLEYASVSISLNRIPMGHFLSFILILL